MSQRISRPPPASSKLPTARRRFMVVAALLVTVAVGYGAFVRRYTADGQAHVVAVADGDTVTALVDGQRIKIRLWGIDAPESTQEHGSDAKAALAELVMAKDVAVEDRGGDKYGRRLAVLRVAGESVNLRMVKLGWAWWYRRYAPRAGELEAAELAARDGKVGLWADSAAVEPWVFRRRGRGD